MQYLLTQQEYEAIFKKHRDEVDALKIMLQDACTQVAEHKPIKLPWAEDDDPVPWGCVRTSDHTTYCDECPVRKMCPYEGKRYSK